MESKRHDPGGDLGAGLGSHRHQLANLIAGIFLIVAVFQNWSCSKRAAAETTLGFIKEQHAGIV